MNAAPQERIASQRRLEKAATWGTLPRNVRLLYVTTPDFPASRLRELFQADSAMTLSVEEALGGRAALARLREESFDVLFVRHAPPDLDALDFIEGYRAGGADEPLVALGQQSERDLAPLFYEVGADAYLSADSAAPRQMIWTIGRAIEWRRLVRENRRLVEIERQRLRLEHGEAERLLSQQRGIVAGLEELSRNARRNAEELPAAANTALATSGPLELPSTLALGYRELLRAHVIMGSGHLAAETAAMVDALCALNLPAPRVMQLHVHALEETLRGLGSRGSRHVMARADLLVLEVMVQLAERYRRRM